MSRCRERILLDVATYRWIARARLPKFALPFSDPESRITEPAAFWVKVADGLVAVMGYSVIY
jgi:hypothetical protein